MGVRQTARVGAFLWASAGATLAWSSFGTVNDDARAFVGSASAIGPALAVVAVVVLRRPKLRTSSLLLGLSALVTPTYGAWALNAAVLVGAATLLLLGQRDVAARRGTRGSSALPGPGQGADHHLLL